MTSETLPERTPKGYPLVCCKSRPRSDTDSRLCWWSWNAAIATLSADWGGMKPYTAVELQRRNLAMHYAAETCLMGEAPTASEQ